MARTIAQIKAAIIAAKNADTLLSTLSSTSAAAEWNLWTDVVAICQWTLESLFDIHTKEVDDIISNLKPHTLQWYINKAKAFQFGDALQTDKDMYAVIDTAKQIVDFAAASEENNGLRIKVATSNGSQLQALNTNQLTALNNYMNLVKDAGTRLYISSGPADRLQANLTIYYNPLVLDNTGSRLDGTANTPIQDAISSYLAALPFNGLFVPNFFIQYLQNIAGVVICKANSINGSYGAMPLQQINYQYLPDSGYLAIDILNDLSLSFIPHNPL
jgi:hypothetical protein